MTVAQPIILVASGTAKTGRNVVEQLSKTGKVTVRALTRNPDSDTAKRLATLPHVTIIKGDFEDLASLKVALQGVTRAFLVSSGGDDRQFDREVAFLAAATEAGVEVVVRVSTCNCMIDEVSRSVSARAHARIEKYIEAHHAKVVDLQPGWFLTNMLWQGAEAKATGKITYPITNEQAARMAPVSMIDPRDIASAGVAVLLSSEHTLAELLKKGRLEVHGPQPVTFADVLAAISKVTGKPLSFNYIPPDELVKVMQGNGLSQQQAESFRDAVLSYAGLKDTPRPRKAMSSPELLDIWQPKITIDKWAKEFGAAFA